ncbi:MAG: hypothetical protein OEW17_10225 [Gemmatimonadota bacterium]|nr:hypothetical protein [Gemmatimonadota bacterium]MDH4349173.1 hypothetical protein [Gemmatimonadota bacterium]MDH5283556.1 hypothetical protein [Gemmatimonadota bacterium]
MALVSATARPRRASIPFMAMSLAVGLLSAAGCASSTGGAGLAPAAPKADPRVGLGAGLMDGPEAAWNLRVVSKTPPSADFVEGVNSDLTFKGNYVIQGNFNGFQVWDITNPKAPALTKAFFCPASQSDVSVYGNLLFVSSEDFGARLDCAAGGVKDRVSAERLRGIRILDITDIANPKELGQVQTCRGSHTHTLVEDPKDPANIYIYVSGSAPVRSEEELPGCSAAPPEQDPYSALFRIEVIRVPLAHPEQAAIVSSPRIFNDLAAPPEHGPAPEDVAAAKKMAEEARAAGKYVIELEGQSFVAPPRMINPMLDSIVKARNGTGAPTAADSAALREALPGIMKARFGSGGPATGPTQCHDITVFPAIGLAGGACEGYGLLLDISDVANPKRIAAVSDSNFSYWHSATFNNDGSKILFTDEWGGGGAARCRVTDKKEWGANAIFTVKDGQMTFQSYYKLPAPQSSLEICVAHNGSLIPIPGRDIMIQSWYEGGLSMFEWTDAANPKEIGFFDRGPSDSTRMGGAGSWSVYWYNGLIVSSEIRRGLDILELVPSEHLSQNEIDAAKLVRVDRLNVQGQEKFIWPATFVVARAYLDQLERSKGLAASSISSARKALDGAEKASGQARQDALTKLAVDLKNDAAGAADQARVKLLLATVTEMSKATS